jgi:hypothetical protein
VATFIVAIKARTLFATIFSMNWRAASLVKFDGATLDEDGRSSGAAMMGSQTLEGD